MKILFAYNQHRGQKGPGQECFATALRQNGHEVDVWDIKHPDIPRSGYDFGFQIDCCDTFCFPHDKEYPDVYWAFDNWQNYNNVRQMPYRASGEFCGQERYLPRGGMADLVFSMSSLGVQNYANHNIESCYMPIGGDEALEPDTSGENEYDVAAVCNEWTMGHLDNRRGAYAGIIKSKYPRTFITSRVKYSDIGDIYSRSKIVWNYSPCGFDVLNYRVFEAMISGSCLLVNKNCVPSLTAIGFIPGTHFEYHEDTEEDLLRKIDLLLNDDVRRSSIAQEGYHNTKLFHTMRHRMKLLVWMVEQRLKK